MRVEDCGGLVREIVTRKAELVMVLGLMLAAAVYAVACAAGAGMVKILCWATMVGLVLFRVLAPRLAAPPPDAMCVCESPPLRIVGVRRVPWIYKLVTVEDGNGRRARCPVYWWTASKAEEGSKYAVEKLKRELAVCAAASGLGAVKCERRKRRKLVGFEVE